MAAASVHGRTWLGVCGGRVVEAEWKSACCARRSLSPVQEAQRGFAAGKCPGQITCGGYTENCNSMNNERGRERWRGGGSCLVPSRGSLSTK